MAVAGTCACKSSFAVGFVDNTKFKKSHRLLHKSSSKVIKGLRLANFSLET
jgi:hypothetical protein